MKIQGNFYELKSKKIDWKILKRWISMKFGQQAPCYTLLEGEMNSHQNGIRNLNSNQKGKLDWFRDSLNPKLYYWIPFLDLGSY
jgi:hypothetical protein